MNYSYFKKIILILGSCFAFCAAADNFDGTLSVLIVDDFKNNKSSTEYHLEQDGKIYKLNLPKNLSISSYKTGDHVALEGELKKENNIQVQSIKLIEHQKKNSSFLDQRSVVAILINFTDRQATNNITLKSADDMLFTPPASIKDLYRTSSYGQTNFIRLTSNGQAPQYVANLNYASGNSCNFDQWGLDASAALTQAGVNLAPFTHRLYILPTGTSCAFGGVAYLGCFGGYCRAWAVAYGNSAVRSIAAHELGHNLGLHHASTDFNNDGGVDSEYGDYSCIMGSGGYPLLNAPHRDAMSWFNIHPNQIMNLTANGQFILNSLDNGLLDTLQVLKINRGSFGNYYVSYRTQAAPFQLYAPFPNKITVHHTPPGSTRSLLVANLDIGQTFNDTARNFSVRYNDSFLGCGASVSVKVQ